MVVSPARGCDERVEFSDFAFGEPLRGFVEDEELGRLCDAHRDLQKALVAIGQIPRQLIRAVCKADAIERCERFVARPIAQRKLEVGGKCQAGVDRGNLKGIGHAFANAGVRGQSGDVFAQEPDLARGRLDAARDHADERAFARAVGGR